MIEPYDLLKSDLMRMAEFIEIIQASGPALSVIAASAVKTKFRRVNGHTLAETEKDLTEVAEIARVTHARIRAATDPRVQAIPCVGVFRDSEGVNLYRNVVLCTEDEYNYGVHYKMVRDAAEAAGFNILPTDPVCDGLDGAFHDLAPFHWQSIPPREWLVSENIKLVFPL